MQIFPIKLILVLAASLLATDLHAQDAVVSADRMNVVYIGLDNPLTVVAQKYPCNSLIVTADNAEILRVSGCHFLMRTAHHGPTVVTVKGIKNKATVVLSRTNFRVKHIPKPAAAVAGKRGGFIAANVLKMQLGVIADLDDLPCGVRFEVKKFRMTVIRANGSGRSLTTDSGPFFTSEMKALLNDLMPGDEVLFTNIYVDGPQERNVLIDPLDFTIK